CFRAARQHQPRVSAWDGARGPWHRARPKLLVRRGYKGRTVDAAPDGLADARAADPSALSASIAASGEAAQLRGFPGRAIRTGSRVGQLAQALTRLLENAGEPSWSTWSAPATSLGWCSLQTAVL